jgi:hypothetical protein
MTEYDSELNDQTTSETRNHGWEKLDRKSPKNMFKTQRETNRRCGESALYAHREKRETKHSTCRKLASHGQGSSAPADSVRMGHLDLSA